MITINSEYFRVLQVVSVGTGVLTRQKWAEGTYDPEFKRVPRAMTDECRRQILSRPGFVPPTDTRTTQIYGDSYNFTPHWNILYEPRHYNIETQI